MPTREDWENGRVTVKRFAAELRIGIREARRWRQADLYGDHWLGEWKERLSKMSEEEVKEIMEVMFQRWRFWDFTHRDNYLFLALH